MFIYDQFIEYLKIEENKLKLKEIYLKKYSNLEKHHILPKHAGGINDSVVICTKRHHTLAHYYRYLQYGEAGDKIAYTMRWNLPDGLDNRIKLAIETNKKRGNSFWNSDWQKEQGKKGGKITGRKNGLVNRKDIMRETMQRYTYWQFTYKNQEEKIKFLKNKNLIENNNIVIVESNNNFAIVKLKPQFTFADVSSILNTISLVTIKDSNSFSKIARGERKKYYNWELIAIDIDWNLINNNKE